MATITSVQSGDWSSESTWDNGVPGNDDRVVIVEGHGVKFDVDQSSFVNGLASLTIDGILYVKPDTATLLKINGNITGSGYFYPSKRFKIFGNLNLNLQSFMILEDQDYNQISDNYKAWCKGGRIATIFPFKTPEEVEVNVYIGGTVQNGSTTGIYIDITNTSENVLNNVKIRVPVPYGMINPNIYYSENGRTSWIYTYPTYYDKDTAILTIPTLNPGDENRHTFSFYGTIQNASIPFEIEENNPQNKLTFKPESEEYPVFRDYPILAPQNRISRYYIKARKDFQGGTIKAEIINPSQDPLVDPTAEPLVTGIMPDITDEYTLFHVTYKPTGKKSLRAKNLIMRLSIIHNGGTVYTKPPYARYHKYILI